MPQYFDRSPIVGRQPRTVSLRVGNRNISLDTDRGVFSSERVDAGTEVFLKHVPDPPATGVFVDVGCGYGPIAVALALRAPKAQVWAVDVNERALELCRANAAAVGAGNVRVCPADEVPADLAIDLIWSNPPVRIGKRPLQELLTGWLRRLTQTGVAYLVVQKHLGSDSLHRWLAEQGWVVHRLVSQSAYRVLEVRPGEAP